MKKIFLILLPLIMLCSCSLFHNLSDYTVINNTSYDVYILNDGNKHFIPKLDTTIIEGYPYSIFTLEKDEYGKELPINLVLSGFQITLNPIN